MAVNAVARVRHHDLDGPHHVGRIGQTLLGNQRRTHVAHLGDRVVISQVEWVDQGDGIALAIEFLQIE